MSSEFGYEKGDKCNRDGCTGVIDEHPSEGCCSCHINPPCSYCVDSRAFCPVCEWQGIEEQQQYVEPSDEQKETWRKQNEEWQTARDLFNKKYRGEVKAEKLEMRTEAHTHFSQKVIGVFPEGSETEFTILPKARGTFGGRFENFGKYSFSYIAYTD